MLKEPLARLHGAIVKAMRNPEVTKRLADEGSVAVAGTPEEYRALILKETAKWKKVVPARESNRFERAPHPNPLPVKRGEGVFSKPVRVASHESPVTTQSHDQRSIGSHANRVFW
jgi:hypothetical protein